MHDFQAIVFSKINGGPLVPRHDLAIQFNSDPVRLNAQVFDEIRYGQSVRDRALVAVDDKLHIFNFKAGHYFPWRFSF